MSKELRRYPVAQILPRQHVLTVEFKLYHQQHRLYVWFALAQAAVMGHTSRAKHIEDHVPLLHVLYLLFIWNRWIKVPL